MNRLLDRLHATGSVDADALESVIRRQQIYGGSLDTVLLELDAIPPSALAEHLAEANGCPSVPVALLEAGHDRPWDALPQGLVDLGWVMPLRRHQGRVQVAVHPEITAEQRAQLEREVADVEVLVTCEAGLAKLAAERRGSVMPQRYAVLAARWIQALRRRDPAPSADPRPDPHPDAKPPAAPWMVAASDTAAFTVPPPEQGPPSNTAARDDARDRPPSERPDSSATSEQAAVPTERGRKQTYLYGLPVADDDEDDLPPLDADPSDAGAAEDVPEARAVSGTQRGAEPRPAASLSERLAGPLSALRESTERDQATDALVRAAMVLTPRVALFGVKREGLRGLDSPGEIRESVGQQVDVGPDMRGAIDGATTVERATDLDLRIAIGQEMAVPCLFVPVRVQNRAVLVLYADRDGEPFTDEERSAAREMSTIAGQALENVLKRMRQQKRAAKAAVSQAPTTAAASPAKPSPAKPSPAEPSPAKPAPAASPARTPASQPPPAPPLAPPPAVTNTPDSRPPRFAPPSSKPGEGPRFSPPGKRPPAPPAQPARAPGPPPTARPPAPPPPPPPPARPAATARPPAPPAPAKVPAKPIPAKPPIRLKRTNPPISPADKTRGKVEALASPLGSGKPDSASVRGRIALEDDERGRTNERDQREALDSAIHAAMRGGPQDIDRLRQIGMPVMQRIAKLFPGELDVQRRDLDTLPPLPAHGALIRVVLDLGAGFGPHLVDLLDHPNPTVRFYAAFTFMELRHEPSVPALGERAFDPDADVRAIAMRVLETYSGETGFADAVASIRRELDSPNRTRQLHATRAIGTVRDIQAVPKLIDLLASKERYIQEAALESLCSITGQQLGLKPHRWRSWYGDNAHHHRVEWIISSLAHKDLSVRRWAADELRRITGQRIQFLAAGSKQEREIGIRKWIEWWNGQGRSIFT